MNSPGDKSEDVSSSKEEEKLQKEQEEAAEKLKQVRFKRLMNLLRQSIFFTDFLAQKLSKAEKEYLTKRSKTPQLSSVQDERSPGAIPAPCKKGISSQVGKDLQSRVSLRKKKRETGFKRSSTPKKMKKADSDIYDLSTVMDKETIQNIGKDVKQEPGPSCVQSDTDIKQEPGPSHIHSESNDQTRVTASGHVVPLHQPLLFEGGVLRDYQLDALAWLKCLYENGVNGILADEMGLGKTLEVISFLCHLIEKGNCGPFLVVAPLSTIPNWLLEFERFAPQVPVLLYHGTAQERLQAVKHLSDNKLIFSRPVCPVLITSFEVVLKDKHVLQSKKWRYMIIDEGHRLKNPKSRLASSLLSKVLQMKKKISWEVSSKHSSLSCVGVKNGSPFFYYKTSGQVLGIFIGGIWTLKSFSSDNRLLLTGTPLQNNIAELWALLNFLLPDIFHNLEIFQDWFSIDELEENSEKIVEQEEKNQIVTTMHKILTPFLLRRTKADVALSIPPKKELVVYAPMTPIQHHLYENTVNSSIERLLLKEEDPVIKIGPDGKCQKRKCTTNKKKYSFPNDSWSSSDESEGEAGLGPTNEEVVEIVDKKDMNVKVSLTMQNPSQQLKKIVNHPYLIQMPLIPGTNTIKVDDDIIRKSGKMMVMDAMLTKLKSQGHKVLIFSTSVMMLDLLEEYVLYRKYVYCRLDGSTDLEDRKMRIAMFNVDPNIFLFLISTRAGGLGINLTAADTVIIYDSDWNPQVDLQAQDRCHRIGQTKPVVVYRLVTGNTYDEKIVERANAKRKLERIIIRKDRFRLDNLNLCSLMTLKELKELLHSSHYEVAQPNGFVFTDDELEVLLDRSDLMGDSVVKSVRPKRKIFKKIDTLP